MVMSLFGDKSLRTCFQMRPYISICGSFHPSIRLSVRPSARPSVRPSVCPSICFWKPVKNETLSRNKHWSHALIYYGCNFMSVRLSVSPYFLLSIRHIWAKPLALWTNRWNGKLSSDKHIEWWGEKTSPGGQIDASVMDKYMTTTYFQLFLVFFGGFA